MRNGMPENQLRRKRRESGSAIVETALMMPWLVFLFVGVLDMGFFCYALICTQNAARAAAIASATSSIETPCAAALGELNGLPNMIGVGSCGVYPADVTDAQPVSVCIATLSNTGSSDTSCTSATQCADCTLDAAATSKVAKVAYRSLPMVPIPGILMGQLNVTRTAEMRVIQ